MILRNTYIVTPRSLVQQLHELPLQLDLEGGSHLHLSEEDGDEEGKELRLVREHPVKEPLEIELENSGWSEILADGSKVPLPRLRIPPGSGPSQRYLDDFIDCLSFLTDLPVHVRHVGRGKLIPESQDEIDLIEKVGSDEPFTPTELTISVRTTSLMVDEDNIRALMAGPRVGVRLYADALRLSLPTSKFREFWRVLESAFNQKGKSLVKCLANYKPAMDICFDEEELNELLVLRGRASHAETSVPDIELNEVEGLCQSKITRLSTLVERVILTKRTWGARSGGVRKPAPAVMSYVGKDGGMVVIQNWKKQLRE